MSKDSSSFAKKLLGVIIILVVAGGAFFLYNKYAETYGNPTWQEAFTNASSLVAQNDLLNETNQDLVKENENLKNNATGVNNNFFLVALGVLAFIIIIAYSMQTKKGDTNITIEEFNKMAVMYAYLWYRLLPSSGYVELQNYLPKELKDIKQHPDTLTYTRFFNDIAVIAGKDNTKYYLGGFTIANAYGLKTPIKEKTFTVVMCSNDINDVRGYPATTPLEAKKFLKEDLKARNNVVPGATESELVTSLGQKVLHAEASRIVDEETQ